jgi:hypothetical protein
MRATVTAGHQFTDAEFQAEIIELTGTKCLPWLKEWCELNHVSRASWSDLYQDALYMMSRIENRKIEKEQSCCVAQTISEIEGSSKATCKLLGWVILPSKNENGFGSHEIYDGNILLDTIVKYGDGYSVFASKRKSLFGDIYTAALETLPPEVLENKIQIRKLDNALFA